MLRKGINLSAIFICLVGSFFVLTFDAQAGIRTVKSGNSDTVYYLDDSGTRHTFPNYLTYKSWFGADFSQVEKISSEELAKIPLGANVVIRPGKYLIKVPSSPKVYAVEPGGVLRHITSEAVLKKIYGEHWLLKLRDLPEIFFDDYQIGDRIDFAHQVPDGSVVKLQLPENKINDQKNEDKYYWKNNQILEPFASFSDILANGYNKQDIINVDIDLFQKLKPIQGKDKRIFNLSLGTNISTATCQTDNLSAAVLFVTRDEQVEPGVAQVLQATVDNLGPSWQAATGGLSKLSINPEFFVIKDKDGFLTTKDENGKPVLNFEEMMLEFYENQPDQYDFIIVYNDFLEAQQKQEKASFRLVRNDFNGTNRLKLDRDRFNGSHGRLKGIVNMNKISQYTATNNSSLASLLNLLHHELLHQWGASVTFINNFGSRSWDLLGEDKAHWSRWVNWVSPLGGWGWEKSLDLSSGKAFFTSKRQAIASDEIIKFPEIDLYLMGLIPARYMKPLQYLVPADPDSVSHEAIGVMQTISIDDIIAAHGPWLCQVKN